MGTAPSSAAKGLLAQIGTVNPDCSNVKSLPVISFSINGKDFDLGPDFYVIRQTDGGKVQCQVGIEPMDALPGMWILGDPFLRKYYTVWDADQNRVGFALAKQPSEEIIV